MENSVTFDSSLEYGATFRFPVTWSYLTATAEQTRPNPPQATAKSTGLAPVSVPTKPEPPPAPAPTGLRSSGADAKWEMVIPKMARPIPLSPTLNTASRTAPRAPRVLEQLTPEAPRPPAPSAATTDPAAETPAEISFYADSEASFVPRKWKVLSLCVAVVVVGGVLAWVRPGSDAGSRSAPVPTAAGTWSRRTAYAVGGKGPREILIYSGSQDVKNYRIEFVWVPDSKPVGWIFRATDSANYFAANLRQLQAGATPTFSAEHFAVVKGVEGPHARKIITLGQTNREVMVRMDADGPAFTLYLQGNPMDYWTDERFETGSLGFYEDRGERPVLQSVRFTLFKKSGLQTVVTSLQ